MYERSDKESVKPHPAEIGLVIFLMVVALTIIGVFK